MLWGEQNLSSLQRDMLWQPRSGRKADWHHGLSLGVALGMTPGASLGRPHMDTGKRNPRIPCATQTTHRLRAELWRNGMSCMLTPLTASLKGINTSLPPTPISRGDAMVGAGEEELRANNSNRNGVEPFQLFICQMDSFPAPFFFFCYKNKF